LFVTFSPMKGEKSCGHLMPLDLFEWWKVQIGESGVFPKGCGIS
jgi:hypothetical protein